MKNKSLSKGNHTTNLEVFSEVLIKGEQATAVEIIKQVIADSTPAKEIFGGLVDYVIRRQRSRSTGIRRKWGQRQRIPFEPELHQMLTEKYYKVVQEKTKVGTILQ